MGGAGATLPQWFDSQTLFTAAGSTTIVITVTAVVQRSLPTLPARWFAFALSLRSRSWPSASRDSPGRG